MKIAIIGAMEEEISLLRSQFGDSKTVKVAHLEVHLGTLNEHQIILVQSGIGKVASACATTLLIKEFNPDYVINTGSAGGFDKELNIGDIVIADKLTHHDVNVTHFGYELGQVPQMPAYYASDETLLKIAIQAIDVLTDVKVKTGLVCTGDSFIGSDEAAELVKTNFTEAKAVEMEGAAIAQTAYMMNTPFLIIRSLSDIAGKTSTMSFEAYLEIAAKNSASFVIEMINQL